MNTDERLLGIAEAIAEGRTVDWSAVPADADAALVRQLREIAGLAGCLDQTLRAGSVRFAPESGEARGEQAPGARGPESSQLAPPSAPRFAHLEVGEPLGKGSNGTVYRAFDQLLQRQVALKLCAPRNGRGEQMLREARLMAQLDHPNVLKVYGAAEHNGVVGFWSDLIEGEPMTRWAESHSRLSARELLTIGEELAAALAAIHALGVVHGDLKPANVVRHRDGRWIVLDFGSSAPLDGDFESGTPAYAAPELLAGGRPGRATDLYSLAALLFRLASGRLPVEAESLKELHTKLANGERAHLLDLRPDLPPRFAAAIERALSTEPEARPASAGEFAQQLGAALRSEVPPARRTWFGVALLALLLGAVAVVALLLRIPTHALPATGGAQLVFEKSGRDGAVALRDGDRIAPGDALSLSYRNDQAAYVYVLNEDDSGAVFELFPLTGAELTNPVPAGSSVRLPGRVAGEAQDWQVTSRGGRERFFVVVAAQRIPALEQLQLAEARSDLPVIGGGDLLAQSDGPVRGVGGLSPRPPAAPLGATRMGTWLEHLRQNDSGIAVQRYELINQ
jgi:hypothetical protein